MSQEALESLKKRYLNLGTPEAVRILKIQDETVSELRAFLKEEGFVEILAPIIGPVTDPGIRGAKQVSIEYYGVDFKVMSSMILYKQMMITSIPKIFALSPNVRLEPLESIKTRRHLTEFRQIDLEVANATYQEVMRLGERMLCRIIAAIKEKCNRELEEQKRSLNVPQKPFKKYTYKEAIEILQNLGINVEYGSEIPWDAEEALSKAHNEPFWIIDYPVAARGFYYMEHEDNPAILRDFDLMYPEGFGEAISGGEREYRCNKIVERMLRCGENISDYEWYLDMLRSKVPRSAGFGIGVERLTRFVCGLENIWDAVPFPRIAGVHSP